MGAAQRVAIEVVQKAIAELKSRDMRIVDISRAVRKNGGIVSNWEHGRVRSVDAALGKKLAALVLAKVVPQLDLFSNTPTSTPVASAPATEKTPARKGPKKAPAKPTPAPTAAPASTPAPVSPSQPATVRPVRGQHVRVVEVTLPGLAPTALDVVEAQALVAALQAALAALA